MAPMDTLGRPGAEVGDPPGAEDSVLLEIGADGAIAHVSSALSSVCGIEPTAAVRLPLRSLAPALADAASALATKSSESCVTLTTSFNGVTVEAQGARVLDSSVWVLSKPMRTFAPALVPNCVPDFLLGTPGFLVDVFCSYLAEISTFAVPPPPQELCRICERFVKTWWFARHHWFCAREHKMESGIAELRERALEARQRARSSTHLVRVSSPLANDNRRLSPFHLLSARCDAVLALDVFEIRASVDAGTFATQQYPRLLELCQSRGDVPPPLRTLADLLARLINGIILFAKFLMYRKALAEEMERSIYIAIEATLRHHEEVLMSDDELRGPLNVDPRDAYSLLDPSVRTAAGTPASNNLVAGTAVGSANPGWRISSQGVPPLPCIPRGASFGTATSAPSSAAPSISSAAGNTSASAPPSAALSGQSSAPPLLSASNSGSSLAGMAETPALQRKLSSASTRSSHSVRSQRSMRSMRSASSCIETDPLPPPSISDYLLIRLLNRGSYGQVYLARKRLTGELFAIKVLKKRTMVLRNQILNVRHERRVLMTAATSPYVATLHYSFQSAEYLYLVLEYVPGGDVASLLRREGCLSEEWALQYLTELVVAVESVHAHHFLHRDLKPENLLIDRRGHLKLSDFGLSMSVGERCSADGKVRGTPDYLAPECLQNSELTTKADWWSVGCVLFELVYGFPPFNDSTPPRVFANITAHRIAWPELPVEADVSASVKDLITRLLTPEIDQRYGAAEIKAHPLFAGVDWAHVYEREALYVPDTAVEEAHGAPVTPDSLASHSPLRQLEPDADLVFSRVASPPMAPRLSYSSADEDASEFGNFSYRNLPLLEKANTEVIHKINSATPERGLSPMASPKSM